MMLVNGMLVLVLAFLNSEFLKRTFKTVEFQMIDQSLCRNPVHKAKRIFNISSAISQQMRVLRHDHICKDLDPA